MAATNTSVVTEPVPIYKLAHRYLIYDVNVVSHLRQHHNVCGVLTGSLPQASQQNVFLGLPLELMPEDVRLLVEKNVAHVVDDVAQHKHKLLGNAMSPDERRAFQNGLRMQGQAAARDAQKKSEDRKKAALSKNGTENWNDIPDDMFAPSRSKPKKTAGSRRSPAPPATALDAGDDSSLFAPPPAPATPSNIQSPSSHPSSRTETYRITPTQSCPPIADQPSAGNAASPVVQVPSAYPVYKELHSRGYFMSPGLRFGCQYVAYPGDPLRFHSHFLCNGMEWDQEFDLLELVGGGRLGTGVKKGYLVGGTQNETPPKRLSHGASTDVRLFCVEWAGM